MGDLSLGKIQAALASATNEVTIAAANINFDFAVFKYDAPAEYQPLSNALTTKRRQNAEFGEIHVTARRLATLFEGLCPSTPKLLKAYGTRASQICESEDGISIKSRASLFGEYLGVDATSIWAAATSSQSGNAVHVHLLACLLARIWSHSEAVSIWDQIITSRREEIAHKFMDSGSLPFSTLSAATQQRISLSSLAAWDASARAWLKTADAVKIKEQTQFFLICKNLTMPINDDGRLYDSILSAWTGGLQTLERLIDGAPHNIRDGSVLLAISAWHIYPNMMVFGADKSAASTEVFMEDELVAEGGTISVGLSRIERGDLNAEVPRGSGIYWSMPLNRLKHYGKSVRRTRNLLDDGRRISFTDLLQVNLGAIFAQWGVPPRPRLEYVETIIKIISSSVCAEPMESMKWWSMILEPSFDYLRDTVKGDALFDLGSRRPEFIKVDVKGQGLFGMQSILTLQSLLVGKAEIIKFLLYLFNQRLPNIQDAVILGGPEVIHSGTSHQEIRYWSIQIQQYQSPETTTGVIIQQGSLELRRSLDFSEQLPSKFLHDNGMKYYLLVGDPAIAAIFVRGDVLDDNVDLKISRGRNLSIQELKWCFDSKLVSSERLSRFLSQEALWSRQLSFLHTLSKVYSNESMKGSTISCRVFDRPLLRPWTDRRALYPWESNEFGKYDFRKLQELATLCYLETGSHGVQTLPDNTLSKIIAFSVGDSIFVRSELVQDPWTGDKGTQDSIHGFTRLLGNIGRPGLTLLTSPSDLLIADRDPRTWKLANYAPFDGQIIDCFHRTSLHLTVLDWSLPVSDSNSYGQLTTEIHLAEAVVSVHDRGVWIGDIDLLSSLSSVKRVQSECSSSHTPIDPRSSETYMVSLDSWDEVLDPPTSGISFVRAHCNWVARLALVGMLNRRKNTAVCPESSSSCCWQCLNTLTGDSSKIFIL